jgi:hypothetical protein
MQKKLGEKKAVDYRKGSNFLLFSIRNVVYTNIKECWISQAGNSRGVKSANNMPMIFLA